jgi:hypothetical protein
MRDVQFGVVRGSDIENMFKESRLEICRGTSCVPEESARD